MARKVFYCFDYEHDLSRIHQIGNVPGIEPSAPGGVGDGAPWRAALAKGESSIRKAIDRALEGTAITVVFLGPHTRDRIFVNYEIEQSLKQGNALVGIQIHHLPNADGETTEPGRPPKLLRKSGFKMYKYFDRHRLANWIVEALDVAEELRESGDMVDLSDSTDGSGSGIYDEDGDAPSA